MGLLGASYQWYWAAPQARGRCSRARRRRLEDCCGPSHATVVQALRARFLRGVGVPACPTSRRGTRVPRRLLPGEPLGAGPARAEECQSGLSTRVASGERPAAALASPWQNAVGSHQRCTTIERRTVLSVHQRGGIDLDTLDAVALPPALLLGGQPHRSNGQQPPRAGGHAPPRARLHAPHARRRLRDARRRVDAPSGAAQRRRRVVGRSHTRTQALLHVEAEPDPPAAPTVESSDAVGRPSTD